jgi:hypothetical protein
MSYSAPSKPTPQGACYFYTSADKLLWRMGLGFRWVDEDGVLVHRGTRWSRRRAERQQAKAAAAKLAKEVSFSFRVKTTEAFSPHRCHIYFSFLVHHSVAALDLWQQATPASQPS